MPNKVTKANGHIVQSDWNQNDSRQMDYIHNKPDIPDPSLLASKKELAAVESIAKGANPAKVYDGYAEMIHDISSLDSTRFTSGQNIYIKKLGVPDLWVAEVRDYTSGYEYKGDEDFIELLKPEEDGGTGGVQVGYYVLSALETQKVNLTEYQERLSLPLKKKTDKESDYINSTTINGETKKYWMFDWSQSFIDGSDYGSLGRIPFTHYSGRPWVDENNELIVDPPYGLETTIVLHSQNQKYTVPYRDGTGNFQIGQPTLKYHASTKNYVDKLLIQTNGEAFKPLTTDMTYENDYNLITDFDSVGGFLTYFSRTKYPLNGGGFVPYGTILRIKLSNGKYMFVNCVDQSASTSIGSFPRGDTEEEDLIKAVKEATYDVPLHIGRWKFIEAIHPAMKNYIDDITSGSAKSADIKSKTSGVKFLSPYYIDFIVKEGLQNIRNEFKWTPDEQQAARQTLGAAPSTIISENEPDNNVPDGTLWLDTSETTISYAEGVGF